MKALIQVLIIILFFLLAISLAYKIESNFQYYKILYPKKLGIYNSIIDAINKFNFINPLIFLPFFYKRNKKLENNKIELKVLAKRINKSCSAFYIIVFLIIIAVLAYSILPSN